MEAFELALARILVQKEGYTWFPPGVLFPELSLFKSNGGRGTLIRIVRGEETESLQALLDTSHSEAREILSDHPYSGITVVQLITYLTPPSEQDIRQLKSLERHEVAPDIAVYTAWFDFEQKKFTSNLPWFAKGVLSKSIVSDAAEHRQEPAELHELQQDIMETLEQRQSQWQNVYIQSSSKAVNAMLVIIIGLFIWMYVAGAGSVTSVLRQFGAKDNQLIVQGQYWRLVAPMFLHLDFLHLIVNSFALYSLRNAEWIFGSNRFLFIFLMAGITGNVMSFAFSPYPAVGASGAIFGILGSLVYFGTQHRDFFRRTMGSTIWTTLIVNLLLGFMVAQISNSGHIGGLLGGFLASAAIGLPGQRWRMYQVPAGIALIALAGAGLWLGFSLNQ